MDCENKEQEESLSVGFMTAGGRKVSFSAKSLDRARQLLKDHQQEGNEVEEEVLPDDVPEFVGFKTGRGKDVAFSAASMEKARKLLEDQEGHPGGKEHDKGTEEDNLFKRESDVIPAFVGFRTAGGKKVSLSDASIAKAKQLLRQTEETEDQPQRKELNEREDTDELHTNNSEEVNAPPLFVGFQTAGGKSVKLSSAAMERAKKLVEDIAEKHVLSDIMIEEKQLTAAEETGSQFVGFKTAGGKSVQYSSAAMARARTLLRDETDEDDTFVDSNKGFSQPVGFKTARGTAISISEKGVNRAAKLWRDFKERDEIEIQHGYSDEPDVHKEASPFVGFQTATGKSISFSTTSIEKARQLIEMNEEEENREALEEAHQVGFKTAGGKSVSFSTSSITRAKQLMSCEDDEFEEQQNQEDIPAFVGFHTAGGKNVSFSKASIEKARQLFQDEDSLDVKVPRSVGFQTAGGKTVSFSSSSMEKAQRLLKDDQEKEDQRNDIRENRNHDNFCDEVQSRAQPQSNSQSQAQENEDVEMLMAISIDDDESGTLRTGFVAPSDPLALEAADDLFHGIDFEAEFSTDQVTADTHVPNLPTRQPITSTPFSSKSSFAYPTLHKMKNQPKTHGNSNNRSPTENTPSITVTPLKRKREEQHERVRISLPPSPINTAGISLTENANEAEPASSQILNKFSKSNRNFAYPNSPARIPSPHNATRSSVQSVNLAMICILHSSRL